MEPEDLQSIFQEAFEILVESLRGYRCDLMKFTEGFRSHIRF